MTDVTTVSDKIKEEPEEVLLPSHFLCSLNSVLFAQLTHVLPNSSCIKLYFLRIKLQWEIISRICIASQQFRPFPCREDNVHGHQYLYSVYLRTEIFFPQWRTLLNPAGKNENKFGFVHTDFCNYHSFS